MNDLLLAHYRPGLLLLTLLFFALMIAAGALPDQANALSARFGDKLLHALAYGFMTMLLFHAIKGSRRLRLLAPVVMVALLGLIDESIQSLLPYRHASLLDWLFDVAAAAVVVTLLSLRA
jgi:VanZ family protein